MDMEEDVVARNARPRDDDDTTNSSGDSRVDDEGNPLADGISGKETEGQSRKTDGGDWVGHVLRGGEGKGTAADAKQAANDDDDGKNSPYAKGETETLSRRGSNDNLDTDEDRQQQQRRRRQQGESGEQHDVSNVEEGKQDDATISSGGDLYEDDERVPESQVSKADDDEEQREEGQQQQQLYKMPEEQHGEERTPREGDSGEGKEPQPGENVPQQAGGDVDGDSGEQPPLNADRSSSVPTVPGRPPSSKPNYRMPQEINVAVALNNAEVRNILVKIERFTGVKAFHGGYRHRGTGRVYHHASTQFGQREQAIKDTTHLRTRDTQTFRTRSITMQTTNESGTQMVRNDMHLDDSRDTVRSVGQYQTAVEFWGLRAQKTVVIQRFWRGFSARSRVWARREEKWKRQAAEEAAAREEEHQKDKQREREMHRRMHPTTVQDFEASERQVSGDLARIKVLYNELDQWREVETKRIQEAETGERRKLALRELLHKETRLLQTIDRLKITAAHEGKERRTRRMFELMSAPKKWEMGDGEIAEISTPWTNRAKELQELYEALEAPLLSIEERLDVLLHLKWTVSEFDCRLTRDIAELVDREADLLSRGRSETSLRPLRQRIRNLFLRFTETPDFNPEATRFLRVPPKYGKLTEEGVAGLTTISA